MHIAVVMGTMLLSGWVLNSSDTEEQAGIPEEVQQNEMMPTSPTSPTMPYNRSGGQGPNEARPMRDFHQQGGQSGSQQGSSSAGGQSIRQMMPTYMPSAPTDSSTDVFGQPAAPTANGASRPRMQLGPTAPTQSSSLESRSGFDSKLKSPLTQNHGAASFGNVSGAPSPAAQKAFAGYQPSSGVSPYMNLFRIGGETIDNYTSLVRPQIEQRFLNQQFNRDIRGLDNSTHTQRVDLQQLYRTNQTLQGVATPQFYMNTGSYYPGAAQGQGGP
jgi:hypothetical protein